MNGLIKVFWLKFVGNLMCLIGSFEIDVEKSKNCIRIGWRKCFLKFSITFSEVFTGKDGKELEEDELLR